MQGLLKVSRAIDQFNTRLGQIVAWALLIAIIVSAVNATVRKVFNVTNSRGAQTNRRVGNKLLPRLIHEHT